MGTYAISVIYWIIIGTSFNQAGPHFFCWKMDLENGYSNMNFRVFIRCWAHWIGSRAIKYNSNFQFSWVFKLNIPRPDLVLVAVAVKTILMVLVETSLVEEPPEMLIWEKAPSIKGKSPSQGGDIPSHMPDKALFKDRLPVWAIIIIRVLTSIHLSKSGKKQVLKNDHINIRWKCLGCLTLKTN